MIAARPPGVSRSGIAAEHGLKLAELVVDRNPECLKTRVAGSIGPCRARPGTLRRIRSASWPVVWIGRAFRSSTIRRAIRRLNRSSPNSKNNSPDLPPAYD